MTEAEFRRDLLPLNIFSGLLERSILGAQAEPQSLDIQPLTEYTEIFAPLTLANLNEAHRRGLSHASVTGRSRAKQATWYQYNQESQLACDKLT